MQSRGTRHDHRIRVWTTTRAIILVLALAGVAWSMPEPGAAHNIRHRATLRCSEAPEGVGLFATALLVWTRNGIDLAQSTLTCAAGRTDRRNVVQPHQANDWHLTITVVEGDEQVKCRFDDSFRRDRSQRINEICVVHSPGWARFRLLR